MYMLIIEQVLEEEYWRSLDITDAMEEQLAQLPKGTIYTRQDGDGAYSYLKYRDGKKIKSLYIKQSEVDELRSSIERRKRVERILKDQAETRKIIVRGLGRTPNERPSAPFIAEVS